MAGLVTFAGFAMSADSWVNGDYCAELIDRENILKTAPTAVEPEKSTLVVALDRASVWKRLCCMRLFGLDHPKNSKVTFELGQGGAYGLKQF